MSRFIKYLKDTAAEMKRVSWPSRNQALIYSALVISISVLVALFLSGFDYLFTKLLNLIV